MMGKEEEKVSAQQRGFTLLTLAYGSAQLGCCQEQEHRSGGVPQGGRLGNLSLFVFTS